jgi:hypothetical protein
MAQPEQQQPKQNPVTQQVTRSPFKRMRVKPRKPSGRYLAKDVLEFAMETRDARGVISLNRVRIEPNQRIPESISDEVLASLEDKKLIEPEFVEDNGE